MPAPKPEQHDNRAGHEPMATAPSIRATSFRWKTLAIMLMEETVQPEPYEAAPSGYAQAQADIPLYLNGHGLGVTLLLTGLVKAGPVGETRPPICAGAASNELPGPIDPAFTKVDHT
jgi:hypothetical protein